MTHRITHKRVKTLASFAALAAVLALAGCAKKAAKVTPPPPPAPTPAPTATLAANPSVVQQGQSSTLTWQTSNANEITIAGLGTLPPSGSRTVMPSSSTTYDLVAKGPGGTNEASARITVNTPIAAATPSPTDEELFAKNVKDVFFDYNESAIRTNEVPTVQNDEAFLSQHPSIKVLVEGHCDDRGSEEYNIALGTSRAETVKQTLEQEGVTANRIRTVSYGKEKPFCTEDNEQCWQQNRVDHFALDR
ncbi:MAG: peptidoglycan-associated lipoprotein Pal [Terriglobales bacterium]|jgi:peptidoglycan-associated lipoprotein